MARKFMSSIGAKLLIWFAIIGLIPMISAVTVTSLRRVHSIKEEAMSKLEAIRDLKATQISQWLQERRSSFLSVASDSSLIQLVQSLEDRRSPEQRVLLMELRQLLRRHRRTSVDVDDFFLIDAPTGKVVASTNPADENKVVYGPFVEVPISLGQMWEQEVSRSPLTGALVLAFSSPIWGVDEREGEVLFVLGARIYAEKSLFRILSDRTGLGYSGETIIINGERTVLSELRWSDNAPLNFKLRSEPASLASEGFSGVMEAMDYRGVSVISAYGPIGGTDWGLLTEQDLSELMATVRKSMVEVGVVLGFSVLMVCLVSFWVARGYAGPVEVMIGAARRFREGDLAARNGISRNDELGQLAREFDSVSAALESKVIAMERSSATINSLMEIKSEIEFAESLLRRLIEDGIPRFGAVYGTDGSTFSPLFTVGLAWPYRSFSGEALEGELGFVLSFPGKWHCYSVTEDTVFTLKGFLGDILPKEVVSLAVLVDGKPYMVVVLGSTTGFSSDYLSYLEMLISPLSALAANLDHIGRREAMTIELQAQNDEIQSQRDRIMEADRLKGQFLSNVSHELRTPLNSILALSRLMLRPQSSLGDDEREYMSIIERNGGNLLELINDVLDLSKIEAGRVELFPEEFELSQEVAHIVRSMDPLAKEKGLVIRGDIPYIMVYMDRSRLRQIMVNLLGNAIKFTDRGSIDLTGHTEGGYVALEVIDTGIGISSDDIPYIFDEFRQGDGSISRQHGGTGLGLAIVSRLVRLMGGSISVDSSPGEGTRFSITLPFSSS
nr:ATP-binding protein [uncultured Dethiosulfovibrio sp.]